MAPKAEGSVKEGGVKKGGSAKKAKKQLEAPQRAPGGKLHYILKRKPDQLKVSDIEAQGNTVAVTGLTTSQNQKVIETMQEDDELLFYQSPPSDKKAAKDFTPAITGRCTVAKAPYPDPEDASKLAFDIKLEEEKIPLDKLKQHKTGELKGLTLLTNNLLTVHHVDEQQYNYTLDDL